MTDLCAALAPLSTTCETRVTLALIAAVVVTIAALAAVAWWERR